MCGKPVSRKSNVDVPSVSDTLTYEILNVGLRRNTEKGKVGIVQLVMKRMKCDRMHEFLGVRQNYTVKTYKQRKQGKKYQQKIRCSYSMVLLLSSVIKQLNIIIMDELN